MSLKSFDKFCEKMINGQPGSEKINYDERQRIVRAQLATESLIIFAGGATVNCFVMDEICRYAESYTAPLVVLMMLCIIYYTVRCAAKDCLVGVSGGFSQKFAACYGISLGIVTLFIFASKEEERPLFVDGKAGNMLFFVIVSGLWILYGIWALILIKKQERKKALEKEVENNEP